MRAGRPSTIWASGVNCIRQTDWHLSIGGSLHEALRDAVLCLSTVLATVKGPYSSLGRSSVTIHILRQLLYPIFRAFHCGIMVRDEPVSKSVVFFSMPPIRTVVADTEISAVVFAGSNHSTMMHHARCRVTGSYCLAPQA